MTPIMRPYILKTPTGDGTQVISVITMIAESHISLHVFPDTDEAFFDLFSCRFFDAAPVVRALSQEFGGNIVEEVLVARGQRYLQRRTERLQVMGHVNQWLAASHPAVFEKLPR
jgi:S-adenosylmethionine/arginine decarboxylase-like enzyme